MLKSFSFYRVYLLLRQDFLIYKSRYVLLLLLVIASIFGFTYYELKSYETDDFFISYPDKIYEFTVRCYIQKFFLLHILIVPQIDLGYYYRANMAKTNYYRMLPSSKLEKATNIILRALLYFALVYALFWLSIQSAFSLVSNSKLPKFEWLMLLGDVGHICIILGYLITMSIMIRFFSKQ